MCSLGTNSTADQQLTDLKSSGDDKIIENKLRDFAGNSTLHESGVLDLPKFHLRDMPDDLTHIRRLRAGRHRVFYTGHHTECSYNVFYIKAFKKTGVRDEHDSRFHKLLKKAVSDSSRVRLIRPPDPSDVG